MPATEAHVDPRVVRSRAKVLDAARELLLDGGVGALTIEAVVQRSGVARSTIYRHWPTRTDVLADAIRGLLRPLPAPPPDGPLADRLEHLLAPLATQQVPGRLGLLPALLSEADRDPELRGFRDRFAATLTDPIAAVLRDGIAAGELPDDTDVAEATSQLLGPLLFHVFVIAGEADEGLPQRMIALFLASRGVPGA